MNKFTTFNVCLSVACAVLNWLSGNHSALLGWAAAAIIGVQLMIQQADRGG